MYKVVAGSRGNAPHFAITCGLQEGYGSDAKTHAVDEVVHIVEAYLKACACDGGTFLTGSVTTGTVVYAWPEGESAGGDHEPQATYSGEKNPLYNSTMSDEDVNEFLNGLASVLGLALGQTRVYVAYKGDMWILQREDSTTPTGETV